jgi:hypothetical protein
LPLIGQRGAVTTRQWPGSRRHLRDDVATQVGPWFRFTRADVTAQDTHEAQVGPPDLESRAGLDPPVMLTCYTGCSVAAPDAIRPGPASFACQSLSSSCSPSGREPLGQQRYSWDFSSSSICRSRSFSSSSILFLSSGSQTSHSSRQPFTITLVIQGQGELTTTEAGLLVGLGIFGVVVTVGLFLYELRQIDICKQLRNHATWIENQLGIEAGQFGGRRERLDLRDIYSPRAHRERDKNLKEMETSGAQTHSTEHQPSLIQRPFIGAEAAGYLVYHAVIGAWLFVLGFGIAELI